MSLTGGTVGLLAGALAASFLGGRYGLWRTAPELQDSSAAAFEPEPEWTPPPSPELRLQPAPAPAPGPPKPAEKTDT